MAGKKIFADVQWWDETSVTVKCPVCENLHTHGFGFDYEATSRASHCIYSHETPSLTYHLRYPFSQKTGGTAYEIDKSKKRYVALGADPPQRVSQDTVADDLAGLSLKDASSTSESTPSLSWTQATEEITLDLTDEVFNRLHAAFGGEETYTTRRLDQVVSRMLLFGDTAYVQRFLDSSSEADVFLHGRDEVGNTALTLAACEKYPQVVELLLKANMDPNVPNHAARTPLMEAALWGRCDNVRLLLAAGADPEAEDEAGFRAKDFTELCKRNVEERYRRSGGSAMVYKENTQLSNEAREIIKCWLTNDDGESDLPVTDDHFQHHLFKKSSPLHLKLLSPTAEYTLSTPWKTIGRLERGGSFPPVSAMSGWSHNSNVTVVSGSDWTDDVMSLARAIGHTFAPGGKKDQGTLGRHHASHAEPQLIAYFVSKHCFLSEEIRPPRPATNVEEQYFESKADVLRASKNAEGHPGGHLRGLASAQPPVMMKKATILSSKAPCGECAAFQTAVNAVLKVNIVLRHVPII